MTTLRTLPAIDSACNAYAALSRLTLTQVGHLLGDDPRAAFVGVNGNRLCNQALAGNLHTIENPRLIEGRDAAGNVTWTRERQYVDCVSVTREAFAAWLSERGTDADRASPAAAWAHCAD